MGLLPRGDGQNLVRNILTDVVNYLYEKLSPHRSGLAGVELFKRGYGLSYADFTLLDTFYSHIPKSDISLKLDVGKGISLETPLWLAPMDTTARTQSCIAISLEGGIGCLHYNDKDAAGKPDVDAQINQLELVKRWSNGFIENPVVVSPEYTIAYVLEIAEKFKSGNLKIDTFPVTVDGSPHGKLVGLLRKQDYSRAHHTHLKVKERMLPAEKLIVGDWPLTLDQANEILWDRHLLYLPIVDSQFNQKYLVTRSDIDKNEKYPLATKDEKGRLRVLFAVDTWMNTAEERLVRGFAAGADGVIVDTSQGFSKYEKDMLLFISKNYGDKLIVGGNISTMEAAMFLYKLGVVDVYRDGQGAGSICTTAGAIGISRSGATGVYECAKILRGKNNAPKTMADGGIKEVGDILKSWAIGANGGTMLGKLFAGTDEAPGEVMVDDTSGMLFKVYRGMGSKDANVWGIRGYGKLPQGVTGKVEYRGSMHQWVPLIRDGLLSALEVLNCSNIYELHDKLYSGELRFERRSPGAMQEAGANIKQ
ncbi:MAG: IMP dehydrogenase [Nanoarchaeota archaeon]|nr:IMP dehydrogenase [Nanoarchaeota archaeon]